jgi:DNA adenine methylase
MQVTHKIKPFLKWPGNKFRCIEQITSCLPNGDRLIEPFAGSGAVFLNTSFRTYILGEKNPDLTQLYLFLQQDGEDFIDYCMHWFQPKFNQASKFYQLREKFNISRDPKLKAALFLYLNRHGYNGLCRFNLKGFFNVPFGSYKRPYFPFHEMLKFHEKAKNCQFICHDFQESFQFAKPGDIIYCDPPYHPISPTSNFTAYTSGQFNHQSQIQLTELAESSAKKGIHVLISNHDTHFTRELYKNCQLIHSFEVSRSISCKGTQRIKAKELVAYYAPNFL